MKNILILFFLLLVGCSFPKRNHTPYLTLNKNNCQLTYHYYINTENYNLSHTVPKKIIESELCIFSSDSFDNIFCIKPYAPNLCIFIMSNKNLQVFTSGVTVPNPAIFLEKILIINTQTCEVLINTTNLPIQKKP